MSQNVSSVNQIMETRESFVIHNEGQKIFGILHKPHVEAPYPLVIICHGLAGHKVGRYRLYVNLATQLTQLGFGVIRFDFRGSGDSEGELKEMTLESQISDALAVLDFAEKHPSIDASRIGIIGRSFGGAVSILAASRKPIVKTFCLWAPVFNGAQWEPVWKHVNAVGISKKIEEEVLTIDGQFLGVEFFRQFFAMHIEKSLSVLEDVPILIIHGIPDSTVQIDNSMGYLKARHHSPGETRFIQLPYSDHDFTHLGERRVALAETLKWFQDTL